MLELFITIALLTISTYPSSIAPAAVGYHKNKIEEEPSANFAPQLREKRAAKLSGEGSELSGSIRYDDQKTVWSDDLTDIEASVYVQHNWQKGSHSWTAMGIGGTINRLVYADEEDSKTKWKQVRSNFFHSTAWITNSINI
ncbi:probable antibacterial peptide [Halyomorpha halys]|uniref:probable antibacterial peptide n=1 Tax=Halyomorpha halys TaxID=286706 RepID=UPI0034D24034